MAAAVDQSPTPTFREVDRNVLRVMEMPGRAYWIWVAFCFSLVGCGAYAWIHQIYAGLGVTGLRQPVMWAIYITNFVFWVGIAHSGTLISAILFLFRTRWRTAVYRAAETMTLFAVATAGLFPLIHLGRVWFAYWLLPYPNERYLNNFRSPLVWDAFAVSTYLTTSAVSVHGPDSRRRECARHPRDGAGVLFDLAMDGRAPMSNGAITRWLICCWRGWRRRWCCRCIA